MVEVGLLAFETPKEKARREGRALMWWSALTQAPQECSEF